MPNREQQINTHLLVYTKQYATEQLERYLRHSITNYFKYLNGLAEEDSKQTPGSGKFKKLVMFQHRCNEVMSYDEEKERDVVDAIVRDKSAPIDSLLKTILLANSMIIGSFGQVGISRHKIKIPTRNAFVMCCLKFAAKAYFTNPIEILGSGRAQREIVDDSIGAAIQDLFPFEKLVDPVVNKQSTFRATESSREYAEHMVRKAQGFSNADVEDAVRSQFNSRSPSGSDTDDGDSAGDNDDDDDKSEDISESDDSTVTTARFSKVDQYNPAFAKGYDRDYDDDSDDDDSDSNDMRDRSHKRKKKVSVRHFDQRQSKSRRFNVSGHDSDTDMGFRDSDD